MATVGGARKAAAVAEDATTLAFGPDFQDDVVCFAVAETAILLERLALRDGRGAELPASVRDAYDYAKRFNRYPSKLSVESVRTTLETSQLHGFELASLMNLVPQDVDEAVSLLPSLRRIDPQHLRQLLEEISANAS